MIVRHVCVSLLYFALRTRNREILQESPIPRHGRGPILVRFRVPWMRVKAQNLETHAENYLVAERSTDEDVHVDVHNQFQQKQCFTEVGTVDPSQDTPSKRFRTFSIAIPISRVTALFAASLLTSFLFVFSIACLCFLSAAAHDQ